MAMVTVICQKCGRVIKRMRGKPTKMTLKSICDECSAGSRQTPYTGSAKLGGKK